MAKPIDITGQKFFRLTAIERVGTAPDKQSLWLCRCDCGKETVVKSGNLKSNHTKSCGCLKGASDLTGMKFHRLTVLGRAVQHGKGPVKWFCRCDCNHELIVEGYQLTTGGTKSCGCLRIESFVAMNTRHGMCKSPEYNSWDAMIQRCRNPLGKNYHHYGGRGITVCERWLSSFENFYADMGPKPTPKHSIDRINNDGNYEPGNCRWATQSEQNFNKRRSLKGQVKHV